MTDRPPETGPDVGSENAEGKRCRLVSFLGTTPYTETTYRFQDLQATSSLMPIALSRMLSCDQVSVLATDEATKKHEAALRAGLSDLGIALDMRRIPTGRSEEDLREQFRVFRDTMTESPDRPLVIDITLGFRAQPFFAAAGLAALSAAGKLPGNVRILYGAFEAKEGNTAPIWDLTPFLDMVEFAFSASTFRRTGDGRPLADALERERRKIAMRAKSGARDFARSKVIEPLRAFSEDLSATRLASLLVGVENRTPSGKTKFAPSSTSRLRDALKKWREECDRDHPALVPMLDDLLAMTTQLAVTDVAARENGLAAPEARQAVAALSRLYLDFGRLMEAAAVAREEIVSRLAAVPEAISAARTDFDRDARQRAERIAGDSRHLRGLFDRRNDMLHAGMRADPLSGKDLAKQVEKLAEEIARPPITVVVSRHPGAVEWLEKQGIVPDATLEHLSEADLDSFRVGDSVVGILPIEFVGRLCEKGVRCEVISLATEEKQRGRELDCQQLEDAGARLVRVSVQVGD